MFKSLAYNRFCVGMLLQGHFRHFKYFLGHLGYWLLLHLNRKILIFRRLQKKLKSITISWFSVGYSHQGHFWNFEDFLGFAWVRLLLLNTGRWLLLTFSSEFTPACCCIVCLMLISFKRIFKVCCYSWQIQYFAFLKNHGMKGWLLLLCCNIPNSTRTWIDNLGRKFYRFCCWRAVRDHFCHKNLYFYYKIGPNQCFALFSGKKGFYMV